LMDTREGGVLFHEAESQSFRRNNVIAIFWGSA
jgi:hypothetical protein